LALDPKEKDDDKSGGDQQNMQRMYPAASKDGKPFYGNVAFHFSRGALFQRDVQVAIDGCDQHGTFTGRLYVNQGGQLVDWGQKLLAEGMLRPFPSSLPMPSLFLALGSSDCQEPLDFPSAQP
jgi:hypothetical protein